MKMNKKLGLVFMLVMFCVIIAACSNEEPNGDVKPVTTPIVKEPNDPPEKVSDFPVRPINIVVPWGTGGGSDQMMRTWILALKEVAPDVTFNVTNMPGANGLTGLNHAMAQPADGYILYQLNPPNYILDYLDGKNKYGMDDMIPLMGIEGAKDMFYLSGKDDRFADWDEVLAYVKENPGKLKMGVAGLSGFTIASAGGFMEELDLDIELIPYADPSERFAALMGGHVDLLFQRVADVTAFVESGDFKPIIVFSNERMKQYPDVPTTVEKGAPGSTLTILRGLTAPAGTPDDAVELMLDILTKASETQIIKDYLVEQMGEKVYIGEEFKTEFENQFKSFEAASK